MKKSINYNIYNKKSLWIIKLLDKCLGVLFKLNHQIPISISPEKILLCQGAHLGDVIIASSLLPVIKTAYPHAKIGFLLGSWSKEVLSHHPDIHSLHFIDHWKLNRKSISRIKKILHYWKTRRATLKELKSMEYDLAIDASFHFPNYAWVLRQAKISYRLCFESAGFGYLSTHTLPWDAKENRGAAESIFSLACFLPAIASLKKHLLPSLPQKYPREHKNYIVLHMGTGNKSKEWPLINWRKLVRQLLSEGYILYFTGYGNREAEAISSITAGLNGFINLCNQLSWDKFIQTIQSARLLICPDTAAAHVAGAVGTPLILLSTAIHPENLWKPMGTRIEILKKSVPCSPCFIGCNRMSCIQELSVEKVYQKVLQQLHTSY